MPLHRRLSALFALVVLLVGSSIVSAQQSESFGDYEIHYSAIPTGMLNDEIAQSYGIVRSRTRGMIMVTVLRDGEPVTARVDILARDVNDDITEIGARRVRDSDWVSYVGTFPVTASEALTFEITVKPHAGGGPYQTAFRQTFYTGE